MPILYDRDDAKRRVTLTLIGEFTMADLSEAADRQANDHAWGYGGLFDARGRTGGTLSAVDIREIVSHNAKVSAQYGMPGPFAIVPRDEVGYGMARMLATISEMAEGRQIVICRSVEEARVWLDTNT